MRPNLLAWQWSDYPAKHRDRVNLLLHLVAVPLFLVGTLVLAAAALRASGSGVALGLGCLAVAVVVEGRGHAREQEVPTPFAGPLDFASRFVVEQWITFPRFVLTGAWSRSFRAR